MKAGLGNDRNKEPSNYSGRYKQLVGISPGIWD